MASLVLDGMDGRSQRGCCPSTALRLELLMVPSWSGRVKHLLETTRYLSGRFCSSSLFRLLIGIMHRYFESSVLKVNTGYSVSLDLFTSRTQLLLK